ncbi:MAG: homocysteine S-methyltransferase [Alphaproteobacteria bacterium]|nr:homocysteine S-methyltransferase [Alphaproteobacteria bacterium]
MSKYRSKLPQLGQSLFLTDGGIETTLIFLEGHELPYFAAFDLLKTEEGRLALRKYYEPYARIARQHETGLVLESPTWRASADWGAKLGYSLHDIANFNRMAISLMESLRQEFETAKSPMPISGCIGPRGDGYDAGRIMSEAEAQAFHAHQANTFRDTAADLITAITMTNINEAVGVARAAKAVGMPVAISFTVETDGRLPEGGSLQGAIEAVDERTEGTPAYYMVNCAHPTHFDSTLDGGAGWTSRIRGIRANASHRSHAELDAATDLDDGNPVELGHQYRAIRQRLGHVNVLGGCCGTDHRHLAEIAASCGAAA